MPEPKKQCTDTTACAGLTYALDNAPREGYGIVNQLMVNTQTFAESLQMVYYMRRSNRDGDKVLKLLYCPFCGAKFGPDFMQASSEAEGRE